MNSLALCAMNMDFCNLDRRILQVLQQARGEFVYSIKFCCFGRRQVRLDPTRVLRHIAELRNELTGKLARLVGDPNSCGGSMATMWQCGSGSRELRRVPHPRSARASPKGRQNGYKREQCIAGAAEAALAIAGLVPSLRVDLVAPVLCFVRDEPLVTWEQGVMVCSTTNLLTLLESRTPVLEPWQVRAIALELGRQLSGATSRRVPSSPVSVPAPTRRAPVRDSAPRPRAKSRGQQRLRRSRACELPNLLAVFAVFSIAFVVVLRAMMTG